MQPKRIFKSGVVREALEAGKTRYFSGKACKQGHLAERMVSSGSCCECLRLRRPKYDRSYSPTKAKVYRMLSPIQQPSYRSNRRAQRLELAAGRPRPEQCEICGGADRIVFDHCHEADQFRGWICTPCNIVLGVAQDSPERLRALANYLEAFNGEVKSVTA